MFDHSQSSHKKRSQADDTTYLHTADKNLLRESLDFSDHTPQRNNFASPLRS
jgi:hypothetical protein